MLIQRGQRGELAFYEGAMDQQSRRRVVRNRESARASRKRKQDELGRLMEEARQLRERAADLDNALAIAFCQPERSSGEGLTTVSTELFRSPHTACFQAQYALSR